MERLSCIYKIVNKTNGKYYIGSTNDMFGCNGRYKYHLQHLENNIHRNDHLQNAWNKYGKDNFDFIIVEKIIDAQKLLEAEQKYLDIAKNEQDKCYNLQFDAHGGQWSEHTKNKMRGSNNPNFGKPMKLFLGKKHTEETKQKISESNKGKSGFQGKHHTEETKEKIRESNRRRAIKNRQGSLSSPPVTI